MRVSGEETHLTYQRQHSGWAVIPQAPAGVLNEAGLELREVLALAWLDVRAHESRARTRNVQLSCHAHHFGGLGQRAAAACADESDLGGRPGFVLSDGTGGEAAKKRSISLGSRDKNERSRLQGGRIGTRLF